MNQDGPELGSEMGVLSFLPAGWLAATVTVSLTISQHGYELTPRSRCTQSLTLLRSDSSPKV